MTAYEPMERVQAVPDELDGQLPLWTLGGTVRALQLVQADERGQAPADELAARRGARGHDRDAPDTRG